jgi:hypothetical protein
MSDIFRLPLDFDDFAPEESSEGLSGVPAKNMSAVSTQPEPVKFRLPPDFNDFAPPEESSKNHTGVPPENMSWVPDLVIKDQMIPQPPEEPCPVCRQRQYWWGGEAGPFVCLMCQPPANEYKDVKRWWYIVP